MSVVLFFSSVVFNKQILRKGFAYKSTPAARCVCRGRGLAIFFTNLFLLLYYFLWALREYNESWNVARIKDAFSSSQGPSELY